MRTNAVVKGLRFSPHPEAADRRPPQTGRWSRQERVAHCGADGSSELLPFRFVL